MRHTFRFPSFTLLSLFTLGALGAAASGVACGGLEAVSIADAPDATPTNPPRKNPGTIEDGGQGPLREVTTPQVVDLGNVGAGQEVSFVVPAGALGFNILVEGNASDFGGIERITSPTGEVVHDAYTPKGGSHATSSVESSFGRFVAASVPQSEAKAANTPEPGTWTVRFGRIGEPPPMPPPLDGGVGFDAGIGLETLKASVRIQMGSTAGGFIGGRLDLRVYVPAGLRLQGKVLNSTTAASDEGIERRLDVFFRALSLQVGIDRGDVTFHPASSSLSYVDSEQALVDAFAAPASRPDGEQALHVVLTNAIDFGDGMGAWGIAPGIPGAATRTNTTMSAIVLAIGETPAIGDGLTLLHEAGHFFGLNHTTELGGGYADPLFDTPKCDEISIDDPTTLKDCPDKLNIMFPAFYGFAGDQALVSNAQKNVYRGSPIYKAYKTSADATMASRTNPFEAPRAAAERVTLTTSGRPLTPVEAWLSTSLCAHGTHAKIDPQRYAQKHGRDQTVAALRAAASSDELPSLLRKRAIAALHALGVQD